VIEFYKEFGELGYLANYSQHGFTKDGVYYKTVEHYYQAMKFPEGEIRDRIIAADTPKEASNIGRDRNNIRIENFKNVKNQVMFDGILEKFRQNRDIAYKLIETRNKEIVEATVDEYYWGIGKDKTGENNIGKIIVKVREQLKKEILKNIIDKAKKEEEVYIIGHKLPDADSIFSSYLLTKILNKLGVKANFAVLDEINYSQSDIKLISEYLEEQPIIVTDVTNKKFILVDHNNLENLNSDNVIGAIDHHVITGEVYDTLEIEYASTGLLIYDLFKDVYKFSKKEKELIALSVLADTEYLCSSRFSEEDKKLYEELKLDFDVEKLQKKYFVTSDFTKDLDDLLKENYKEYHFDNKLVKRSLLTSYQKEYDKYNKNIIDKLEEDRLLIWAEYENKKTYVYYNNEEIVIDYVLTSTYLIMEMLKEKGML
jgi:ribA/ribD-fused uncharacterized protein